MKKVGSGSSLSHCIFCYKKANCRIKCEEDGAVDLQGHGDESVNGSGVRSERTTDLLKFFTFVERHLGKCFDDVIVNVEGEFGGGGVERRILRELVKCCEDCLRSVRIFNECYHEYKCLEMRLSWRLESVRNVMRFADKVPSRVKSFREGLEGDGNLKGHSDALTRFRQKIANYCREHLKVSFPRVQLHRKKTPTPSEDIESSSQLQLSSVILPFLLLPPPTSGDSSAPLEPSIPSTTLSDVDFEMTGVDDFLPFPATETGHIPEFSQDREECSAEKLIHEYTIQEPDGKEQSGECEQAPVTEIQDYEVSDDDHVDSESSHDDDNDHFPSEEINANDGTITNVNGNLKVEADALDTKPSVPLPSPESPSIMHGEYIPESDGGLTSSEQECSSLTAENAEVNEGPRRLRKLLECARCSMKFSNASRLELHQQSEHLESEEDDGDSETASSEMSESSFDVDSDTRGTDDDEDGSPLNKKIKRDLDESSGDDVKPEIMRRWRGPDKRPRKRRGHVIPANLSIGEMRLERRRRRRVHVTQNLSIGELRLEGIPEKELRDDLQCKNESCSALKFNFPSELEKHSKFHGEFLCERCETVKDFAPDFALHQLEHCPSGTEKGSGNNYLCWKCGRLPDTEAAFVKHFILMHMEELNGEHNRCLICRKKFCGAFPIPTSHYAANHDLNRLDPSSKPFYCKKGRCRAYFLEEHQRTRHRVMDSHDILRVDKRQGKMSHASYKGQPPHPSRTPIKCPHCPRKVSPWNLKYHMALCHPDPDSKEPLVRLGQKLITDPNGITKTVKEWVSRKGAGHACPVEGCGQAYFTDFELQIHSKTHGNFSCGICKETCGSAMTLATHELEHSHSDDMESETTREVFKCPRCRFKRQCQEKCVHHFLKKHLGLQIDCVRCPICMAPLFGYLQEKGRLLFKHFIDQHRLSGVPEEKIEKCEQCPAYFLNKFQLDDHMKEVHSTDVPGYSCHNCGKVFSRKMYLINHKTSVKCRLAEQQLEFLCTATANCGRRFKTGLELDRHMLTCKKYLLMECPQCGKVVRGKGPLMLHMKAHDESRKKDPALKRHVCEQCGKVFGTPENLKQHMLYHQDPDSWKFECPVCSKKCVANYKLVEHMRTHSQEKPYVCQTCGVKYAHLHNLRIHRKTKHGIEEGRRLADTSNCASRRKGKKLTKRPQPESGSDE